MGSFTEIFGKVPRILVLEAFAEDPDEHFTAPEIMRITGVSRRAAYLIIQKFVKEGLLLPVRDQKGASSYVLNNSDLRAVVLKRIEPLLVIGKLESELKLEEGIPSTNIYPNSYLNDLIVRPPSRISLDPDIDTTRYNPTSDFLKIQHKHLEMFDFGQPGFGSLLSTPGAS